MAIPITCECGKAYRLKDGFAGKLVRCPNCGNTVRAGDKPPPRQDVDPVFHRDKFLLHQKHFAIKEKYYVWNEEGETILYVERPAHLARNLGGMLLGLMAGILVGVLLGMAAKSMGNQFLQTALMVLAVLAGMVVWFLIAVTIYRKRHIQFYHDDTKQEILLEILQDRKVQPIIAYYTLQDASGTILAKFRKNYIYNIIRKRWYCMDSNGTIQLVAKEDSIILSLLRRVLGPIFGSLFGILRTNFIILEPGTETVLGEFNRKFTLLDRYVLDMSADTDHTVDRRIALALGVMLDTGEKR